jgi:uncharacterized membrane protein YgdD (TMEM256/DUF423 family)
MEKQEGRGSVRSYGQSPGWATALQSPTLYKLTFTGSVVWLMVAPIGECT